MRTTSFARRLSGRPQVVRSAHGWIPARSRITLRIRDRIHRWQPSSTNARHSGETLSWRRSLFRLDCPLRGHSTGVHPEATCRGNRTNKLVPAGGYKEKARTKRRAGGGTLFWSLPRSLFRRVWGCDHDTGEDLPKATGRGSPGELLLVRARSKEKALMKRRARQEKSDGETLFWIQILMMSFFRRVCPGDSGDPGGTSRGSPDELVGPGG